MASTSHQGTPPVHPDQPSPRQDQAQITINNSPFMIHRGHQTVAAIKAVGGVQPADDLSVVVSNSLSLLPDDGGYTIKGGEVFVSNPKTGASS